MKLLTLTDEPGRYQPFEVVELNGDRWIVIEVRTDNSRTTYTLEPLKDFISLYQMIDADGQKMTIADYLREMEEKFLNTSKGGKG